MVTSSPLAAMHPPRGGGPSMFFEGCHPSSYFPPRPMFSSLTSNASLRAKLHGKGKFDFGTLSSSPAGSLAADLSQNFRLDNESSPSIPTPRRALFTSNFLTRNESHVSDFTSSPPVTSSPADMMDISPIPTRLATVSLSEVLNSPSPNFGSNSPQSDCTMVEDSDVEMDDSEMSVDVQESPAVRVPLDAARFVAAAERRKLAPRRPSLSRVRSYGISGVPKRFSTDNLKFGSESRFESRLKSQASTTSLSLAESFNDSPADKKRCSSINSPSASIYGQSRRSLLSHGATCASNRSPVYGHARVKSSHINRPRKMFRRSISMFEDQLPQSHEILKQQPLPFQPVLSAVVTKVCKDESLEPSLPHHFSNDVTDSIPRISRETMLDVLDGKYNSCFDQKLIIDCRFEYEYEGGHIDGAINYNDKDLLTSHLFKSPLTGRTLLIFHCEFSAHRAPLMARYIRAQDRTVNSECYPKLTYPEVYILEGGYQEFYNQFRERCYPQSYVEMNDAGHINTCEREMDRIRNNRPGRKQIGRAATFAFGSGQADNSPTAPPPKAMRRPVISSLPSAAQLLQLQRMPSYYE